MCISGLMASELEFVLASFRVKMKKKWVRNRSKRFYGDMWGNSVGVGRTCKNPVRLSL